MYCTRRKRHEITAVLAPPLVADQLVPLLVGKPKLTTVEQLDTELAVSLLAPCKQFSVAIA